MRILAAAIILPFLAACTTEAPVAVAPPAPIPVPPGCAVDPATRLAISQLSIDDVITSADSLGLPAQDVRRLFDVRSGSATAAQIAYAQGCLGVKV